MWLRTCCGSSKWKASSSMPITKEAGRTCPTSRNSNRSQRARRQASTRNIGRQDQFGIVFSNRRSTSRRKANTRSTSGRMTARGCGSTASKWLTCRASIRYSLRAARQKLAAGTHAIEVEYFEQGGEQVLKVEYEGNGVKRQSLEYALVSLEPPPSDKKKFELQPELAAKGKKLFGSLGCASCHQLRVGEQRLASTASAKSIDDLETAKGCLAEAPSETPNFHLTTAQRAHLAKSIKAIRGAPLELSDPLASLKALNCYACHERDKVGGVEQARNAFFKTNQPEMGDEGRIPPLLTGVGAKLKPAWMKHIFDNGAKDRPYMFTRMPKFGSQNVGQLVEEVAAARPAS